MTPPVFDDVRKQLWHLRRSTAQWVAPTGLGLQRSPHPPGSSTVLDSTVSTVAAPGEAETERRGVRRREALAASGEARTRGDRARATEELRRLLLEFPDDAQGWYLYAMRLMEAGNYDASFEALKNCLDQDPGNLDALEMLIEATSGEPQRQPASVAAYRGLLEVLPQRPDQHRRALDFVVPNNLTEAFPVLATSPDRITRAVMEQAVDPEAEYPRPPWLAEDEYLLARLLFSLQRGRRSTAIELMHALPDRAISRWSLRQSIRRDLRANKMVGAQRLLVEYRRLEPDDGWAKALDTRLRKTTVPTNYQLTKQGFPFPQRRDTAVYPPVQDRVFYLLHNSLPYHSAGYSTRTHGLLSGLRDQGWDVRGVTRLGYPYDMPKMAELGPIAQSDVVDGVPYHRLSTTPGIEKKSPITSYVERYMTALETHAQEQRPVIIHGASNHWNGLAAVATANRLGIPSIYEVRGLWEVTRGSRDPEWAKGGMYRFMARMEADAAANATHVLAITQALKDELISRGVDGDKITVVPNAVNGERFQPQERDAGLETALGLQGKTVIGYIGSVLDYEGLGLLIEAADLMRQRRQDFAVLIVGDGAELEKFQEEVQGRALDGFVRFTGRVPHEDVERYYSLVDIAPFPRLPLPVCEMVSPLKPFEALAMGKAVVASDVAALAEIITPGVNGVLHRKGDAEDLQRNLEHLLDDPALREELAERGRAWVLEHRQWSGMSRIVSDIYGQLGGRRQSTAAE